MSPAYDAPFPDSEYKAGARAFPELVPEQPARRCSTLPTGKSLVKGRVDG
ncbi:MAG: hypothetical protein Ct9H300mP14_04550 [Gammaproteobacteria bacterium]|nr:MAG: hypothetical protein Ct9H300mP14_04550 [Gammaproteobacteria bacterium]